MTPREILLGLILVAVLVGGGAIWLKGRAAGVAAEKPKTEAAADLASANGHEAAGERQSAQRVDVVVHEGEAAAAAIAAAIQQARSAPDANDDLDPARADRLLGADERLCASAPELVSCARARPAAAAADAGDRR